MVFLDKYVVINSAKNVNNFIDLLKLYYYNVDEL